MQRLSDICTEEDEGPVTKSSVSSREETGIRHRTSLNNSPLLVQTDVSPLSSSADVSLDQLMSDSGYLEICSQKISGRTSDSGIEEGLLDKASDQSSLSDRLNCDLVEEENSLTDLLRVELDDLATAQETVDILDSYIDSFYESATRLEAVTVTEGLLGGVLSPNSSPPQNSSPSTISQKTLRASTPSLLASPIPSLVFRSRSSSTTSTEFDLISIDLLQVRGCQITCSESRSMLTTVTVPYCKYWVKLRKIASAGWNSHHIASSGWHV